MKPDQTRFWQDDSWKYFERNYQGQDLTSLAPNRFLHNGYVLQEEFEGEGVRLNLFHGGRTVYPFDAPTGRSCATAEALLDRTGAQDRLVKFDVLVSGEQWVVLDIGLDPPARMLADYESRSLNFYNFYVDLFLGQMNGGPA